ncbi:MAG: DoxX family protein [Oscillatoriales cyanobacterium RM2_1_1]|nr:DoxX family protein [Oscillatoriales cyanobacterium RM2_1_1]
MIQKTYSEIRLRQGDIALAYALLRIVFGINFFVHGLVRIGNIPGFVQGQIDLYQEIAIPSFLLAGPAFLIPIVELIVGFLLILGLKTRIALIAGFLLMMPLMFGVCLLQKWDVAGSQLTYCLIYFILLAAHQYDLISLDHWRRRNV